MKLSRHLCLILALMASLALPTLADAAPKKKYKSAKVTRGYGFLPGYRPPPPQGPLYSRKGRHRYDEPRYDDMSRVYMWGGAGNWTIYRNHPVGPVFGPCWKHTPIGPHWTCG